MLPIVLLALATPLTSPTLQTKDLDAAVKKAAIEGVLEALEANYVFPDVADEMAVKIREAAAKGDYDGVRSGPGLAGKLQSDLQAICRDRHLTIQYHAEALPEPVEIEDAGDGEPRDEPQEDPWAARLRSTNWGFTKVEVLPGNVGLLELSGFAPANEESLSIASAAMSFLAGTDALIVDLRRNGGGSPAMVAFLQTYLFGPDPVHLNSLEEPRRGTSRQWWTLPYVPGRRFGPDKPVFVLTSGYTFSAAEEYTYNLYCRERATVVGETTGGGAHPVDRVRVHPHFSMMLPIMELDLV